MNGLFISQLQPEIISSLNIEIEPELSSYRLQTPRRDAHNATLYFQNEKLHSI